MSVRVRFAPSPTGTLHIGSARTALFNWLYARNQQGTFILRIEDTDRERSKKEFLDEIVASLKWLGLDWDEGPFFQTERLSLYREYAERLVQEGKAYYCEPEHKEGQHAVTQPIKFKVPHETIVIDDQVHGRIEFDNMLLEDFVIMKSDGFPTYNFACVIDDADMKITHVIRGDDHISNTPKQIPLYRAFGFSLPKFAHIPLILGEDKTRLSKRHGATSISEYRQEGIIPEGLLNFLSLLGWSPGKQKEIMSREEIIKEFSLKRINKTNAVFGYDKLKWINAQHIKTLDTVQLTERIHRYLCDKGYSTNAFNQEYLAQVVKLFQGRMKNFDEFYDQAESFLKEEYSYKEDAQVLLAGNPLYQGYCMKLAEAFAQDQEFSLVSTERILRALAEELGLKAADLIHPVRAVLTGRTVSPSLFEVIVLLGKEKVLTRLKKIASQ